MIPQDLPVLGSPAVEEEKPANHACRWLRPEGGCVRHDSLPADSTCRRYACAWVLNNTPHLRHLVRLVDGRVYPWRAHRPDGFRQVLAEPWVEMPGVMPMAPETIPLWKAIELVRRTRMIPAARAAKNPGGMITGGFRVGLLRLASGAGAGTGETIWARALDGDDGLPCAA